MDDLDIYLKCATKIFELFPDFKIESIQLYYKVGSDTFAIFYGINLDKPGLVTFDVLRGVGYFHELHPV